MLSRRACGSRRVVIIAGGSEGSFADPAVDLEAMGQDVVQDYWDSLFDPDLPKFKPGEEPTWFTIRPLTSKEKDVDEAQPNARSEAKWRVQCGLLRLENYEVYNDAGERVEVKQPDRKDSSKPSSDAWFHGLNMNSFELTVLSAMIKHISEARPPLSKPSAPESGEPK